MLFHSASFAMFLAVVFAGYWLIQSQRARLGWLVLASVIFYGTWNPWLVSLVLFTAGFDYVIALRLESATSPTARRVLLILSLTVTLGLLAFFKYSNFFLDSATDALRLLGWTVEPRVLNIILPLGISFYTFETISYVVDVYRRRTRAERDPLNYALFLLFFPHLIAGPIVRPHDFLPQTHQAKRWNWDRLLLGARLFLLGLVKKAVIADHMAQVADPVFAQPGDFGGGATWIAVVAYAVQIYCDFSGYSDMAIGTAHFFGFKLPRNFDTPYLATSIAEFWRRWHITLSTWLRDYLYIPLGGSRRGTLATYRNLIVTMLLGGLWHGAAWTFVAWGAYHGLLLALHRAMPWPAWLASELFRPLKIACTFVCVCVGWVFFRAQSFTDAGTMLRHMFTAAPGQSLAEPLVVVALVTFAVVALAHAARALADVPALARRLPVPVAAGAMAVILLLVQMLMPAAGAAFIYFQF